jgi:hypothetical protein
MEQKKLEPGSAHNEADLNNDGIVSDKELATMEKLHEIERADKLAERQDRKQKQQRYMAWTAIWSMVAFTAIILSPIIPDSKLELLGTLLSTFYIAQAGIVGAFMGFATIADKNQTKLK